MQHCDSGERKEEIVCGINEGDGIRALGTSRTFSHEYFSSCEEINQTYYQCWNVAKYIYCNS